MIWIRRIILMVCICTYSVDECTKREKNKYETRENRIDLFSIITYVRNVLFANTIKI